MVQMELMDKLASRIGLHQAILLMRVRAWIHTNAKKGINAINGRHWTYNSIESWHQMLPYLSVKQIRTAMGNLREMGYLLAEKAKKKQWNQTLYYTLSDRGEALFSEIEYTETETSNDSLWTNEAAGEDKPIFPESKLDSPCQANEPNGLPIDFPCNSETPSSPKEPATSLCEDVHEDYLARLQEWNIPETDMRELLSRTGESEGWACRWLGIMRSEIESGRVAEYHSPLGALMVRHRERWPFPRSVSAADLPETKVLKASVEASRRLLHQEYENARPEPGSIFLKHHNEYFAGASV